MRSAPKYRGQKVGKLGEEGRMNVGQAKMTDIHLPRTASSNVVTSWIAGKLLQAVDLGIQRSRVCHFLNRSVRPIADENVAVLRTSGSSGVWMVFSIRIDVGHTWHKKVSHSQTGLIRHK